MYDVAKAAQAAAVLLAMAPDRSMGRLKLMKLLYIADRQAFGQLGSTISHDRLVAMPHGPALSRTLGALQMEDAGPEAWSRWVSPAGWKTHRLTEGADLDQVDALSEAEIGVLIDVWATFGHMTGPQLRTWTHDPENCPEWSDPHGSSRQITLHDLGEALGMDARELAAIEDEQQEQDEIHRLLAVR